MSSLVSIVLPVYRQADHIERVVASYEQALSDEGVDYEILLVVNGPNDDGTHDICKRISASRENLRFLLSDPAGWGGAVTLGLQESRGDPVCYTNSARTSAAELAAVVRTGMAHPDALVKATRKIRESFMRRAGSLLFNLECRALFNLPYWDINGTPKLFPRRLDRLLDLKRRDDLIDLEVCIICREAGYQVVEIPVLSAERHGGRSTTKISSAMNLYIGAYRMKQQKA